MHVNMVGKCCRVQGTCTRSGTACSTVTEWIHTNLDSSNETSAGSCMDECKCMLIHSYICVQFMAFTILPRHGEVNWYYVHVPYIETLCCSCLYPQCLVLPVYNPYPMCHVKARLLLLCPDFMGLRFHTTCDVCPLLSNGISLSAHNIVVLCMHRWT